MSTQFLHIFLILLPLAAKVLSQNRCTTFDDIWRYLMILDDIGWYLMMFDDIWWCSVHFFWSSSPLHQKFSPKTSNAYKVTMSLLKEVKLNKLISFEPSCCPERTVLGSDGSSVVYQLASGFVLFMIFIIIFGENHICQHIGYCLYFDSHMFQLSYEQ